MGRLTRAGYRRLPGWGPRRTGLFAGFGSRCRLYLGEDHVLSVDNHLFSEDYKRFYFTDIQAVITRKTRRWIVEAAIVFLVAAAMTGSSLLLLTRSSPLGGFWMGLSIMLIVYLLYHLARGPSCACHIVTAVQEDLLPTVNRLRVSRKVIPLLKSAVERAQGSVSPEEMAAAPVEDGPRYVAPEWNGAQGLTGQETTAGRAGQYRGWAHVAAFCLLLIAGVLTAIDLTTRHLPLLVTACALLGVAFSLFVVVALIKQRGGAASRMVRSLTWACFALICLSFCLGYAVTVHAMVRTMMVTPKMAPDQWDIVRTVVTLSPRSSSFLTVSYGFEAACSLVLGGLGLASVLRWRKAAATARPAVDRAAEGVPAP
jgi:hypothetical protein